MTQKNVPSFNLSLCKLSIEEMDHFNFLTLKGPSIFTVFQVVVDFKLIICI